MPASSRNLRICFDRVIPARYAPQTVAHNTAFSLYAALVKERSGAHESASFGEHVEKLGLHALSANDPIHMARLALITMKKWPNAYNLRCRFLDGDDSQREKVMAKAKIWEQFSSVHINAVEDRDAEVRISFVNDTGSWSAIGSDALNSSYFPKDKPTMNLGWLRDDTDDREYERVVVHEFGHALGAIHEHQNPYVHLKWNKERVYEVFSGPPNKWSKEEIDHNILEKYSPEGLSAASFDEHSIMLYQFDADLFLDHKILPLNYQLSDMDKRMIGYMYPAVAAAGKAT